MTDDEILARLERALALRNRITAPVIERARELRGKILAMPALSKHRYSVRTEPGSALRTQLTHAFVKTATIDVVEGEIPAVPHGTFLVVGMNEDTGTFQLQRWRDEGLPDGPREDPY